MYEELYITDENKRMRVDLSIPSGITLNFKSNIFGDLSKITCSFTYTFKLPLTINNRNVFDNADDIRCTSNKIRRRLKAEYVQNGIPLFKNANLYIESTETCYNAIMTWGVIDGFQTLKDNDISIRNLPLTATPTFGPTNAVIGDWSNNMNYAQPLYNAGLPYVSATGHKDTYNTYSVFPLPVVPIYRLVSLINETFSTKFNLGTAYAYGDEIKNHSILNYGVVPLVSATAPEDSIVINSYRSYLGCYMKDSYAGVAHVLTGATNDTPPSNSLYSLVKNSAGFTVGIKINSDTGMKIELDGFLKLKFNHEPNAYKGQGVVEMDAPDSSGITPKLGVYYTTNGTTATSLTSLEGKFSYSNDWCWYFNFSKDEGKDRIECNVPANAIIFLAIEAEANNLTLKTSTVQKMVTFYSTYDTSLIKWSEFEERAGSFPIDLMSNLPDVSCMTLMKALFFMLGAFPTLNAAGEIVPLYYSDIKDNLLAGNTLDWSGKATTDHSSLPNKTSYSVSGFGQQNYYLMKNDNVEGDGSEDETDVYASGIGCINVQNEVIDRTKTIIQLPFYAPYIKNKKAPHIETGNTMKFWYYEGDEVKIKEAKPCFGMIIPLTQTTNGAPTGTVWMSMAVWNGFKAINQDPSYSYLSRIMENPIIITENLLLNEHDLRDLDYSVPVYLEKYSAYFAIVSITRDSKGISKCELLKLPEEEYYG